MKTTSHVCQLVPVTQKVPRMNKLLSPQMAWRQVVIATPWTDHMPPELHYVEPCAGGLAVLLAK